MIRIRIRTRTRIIIENLVQLETLPDHFYLNKQQVRFSRNNINGDGKECSSQQYMS